VTALRVIKAGGRTLGDPALASAIAAAWRGAPGALCVVHGGGDEVSALQRAFGRETSFVAGRRVTSAADVELLRMALSGAANKRLVARLVSAGAPAFGLSGEDAGCLLARAIDRDAMGAVGAPERVDAAPIRLLLGGGFLPVLSPLSRDLDERDGAALNVNADDAAAALAVAIGAGELLLVTDVAGVVLDGAPVGTLDAADAEDAIASGAASGGMAAKLRAALAALAAGVARVRIGDVSSVCDGTRGTTLTPSRIPA
jgi:acetylglutamate kinase